MAIAVVAAAAAVIVSVEIRQIWLCKRIPYLSLECLQLQQKMKLKTILDLLA